LVNNLFGQCFKDNEYKQAIGLALQTRRLDKLEVSITGGKMDELLSYCFDVTKDLDNRDFRRTVLRTLVKLYSQTTVHGYVNICRCLIFLDDHEGIIDVFKSLLFANKESDVLLVFQIAFELVDSATQQFVALIRRGFENKVKTMELLPETPHSQNVEILKQILTGETTIDLYLEFLFHKNSTDMGILNKIKSLFEPRISVLHQATFIANALMHCGTAVDTFLFNNSEWVSKALNWAKFTMTAGIGVIHKGHIKEAMNILDSYLPKPGDDSSPYIAGGSLYALGLIYANHGEKISSYLLQHLKNIDLPEVVENREDEDQRLTPQQKMEIVQHGAALGLGVAAMASQDEECCNSLMELLYHQDSAIAGEAAGVSLGLVMLGSGLNRYCQEILNFARTSQHEKIIRGLSVGLALMMYSREEEAEPMIETMITDKDPILRYGAMFMIGLAYCGTANNNAISRLLHIAVSDVSNDVRRGAVIAIGFVLFRRPSEVPKLVSLLSESYNPHVRYGAAMALGIACSGTGMKEAIELLDPLTKDQVPFVKQGAWIALSMILIQISKKENPRSGTIREEMLEIVEKKNQPLMAKFGAILGLGIIDAGGRNVNISLSSTVGHKNLSGIVGITVFLQYWYWYPYIHFISLAFTPTAIVAVNKNLQKPKYNIKSNAPPSYFSYPPPITPPKEETLEKLPTAQLSTTKKEEIKKKK